MMHTLQRRQLLDLALEARQKYLSPHTGFVHLCYEGAPHDTIPFFENFCAVLALLRSKQAESILEAKELLKRLLAFAVDGAFPIYVHQYPHCYSRALAARHVAPLYWIDRLFGSHLDLSLKPYLRPFEEAITGPEGSPYRLSLELMQFQMGEGDRTLADFTSLWNPELHRFKGLPKWERREGDVPETTLFDLYMSQYFGTLSSWSAALQPIHLQAALIFPFDETPQDLVPTGIQEIAEEGHYEMTWGNPQVNYSLACFHPGIDREGVITYPEELPDDRSGQSELSFFMTRLPGVDITINGGKGTAFRLGDRIEIKSPSQTLQLTFELVEGEGRFMGHMARGSRPNQAFRKEAFQAYDWQISIRTLERTPHCKIRAKIKKCL